MVHAEISDPLPRKRYFQGIAILDPSSENFSMSVSELSYQDRLQQLVRELKSLGLVQSRHDEILDQMQGLFEID